MKKSFTLSLAIAIFSLNASVKAQSRDVFITFKEGNYGTQNIAAQITNDAPGQFFDLRHDTPYDIGSNDEARSVYLTNIRVGAIITVYDSPSGALSDDYCVITVKALSSSILINTFERSYEDAYVKVQFHPVNGLDGKVSAIRIN